MIAIDPAVARRLTDETVIWLTTVTPEGQPQASLVWFLWVGSDFLIFSKRPQGKLRNIAGNPRVGLNLDSDGQGGHVVSIEGRARRVDGEPPADANPAFVEKYRARIAHLGWTPESFAADYSQAIRVAPERIRSW